MSQSTPSEEPSMSGRTEGQREQPAYLDRLEDELKRRQSSQAPHPAIPAAAGGFSDEDFEEEKRARPSYASHALAAMGPPTFHSLGEVKSNVEDTSPALSPYHSTRRKDRYSPPPYGSSPPTRRKERMKSFQSEHPPGFPEDDIYHEQRHPGTSKGQRGESHFEKPPFPSRQYSAKVHEPRMLTPDARRSSFRGEDAYRARNFWDSYNKDPNVTGYRRWELQRQHTTSSVDFHDPPARSIPREQDGRPVPPSSRYDHSILQPANSHSTPQPDFVPLQFSPSQPHAYHYQQYEIPNHYQDLEEDSSEFSDEDNEARMDFERSISENSSGPSTLLGEVNASPVIQLNSNVGADEDLLNPSDWERKLIVAERTVKGNHRKRDFWTDTWRHSDGKTAPKALRNSWAEFLEVDQRVRQLGVDAVIPLIDNSKYQSKRKGTLAEVIAAYQVRSVGQTQSTVPNLPCSSLSMPGPDSWDFTCEQVQRLLKARDYLILVCRDAESLGDLHPTMDAITWFEQAQLIEGTEFRTARNRVIELMSVRISHVAEIIQSLNAILQSLLWSWSDESTMCIQSDQETAKKEDDRDGRFSDLSLEITRVKIIAPRSYDNGEKRIQTCLHTSGLGLKALIEEVEVFAAILSQALYYQSDILIPDCPDMEDTVHYGLQEFPGLSFITRSLECLGGLIQERDVWVLEQSPNVQNRYPYVGPPIKKPQETDHMPLYAPRLYVRATIADLARIWGPIWKAAEAQENDCSFWYRLPGGYIGAADEQRSEVVPLPDEAPCHFSTILDRNVEKHRSSHSFAPKAPYLLIGHGLPSSLEHRRSCHIGLETGLEGMALQSIGTLKPFKYKDSSTLNIAVGHAGAQASWSTQIKTNPGILMKQSLLDRWKLEPKFRNPRLLLLLCGLEVSFCTKNARRCRLVDLIRSRCMIEHLSAVYRPKMDLKACKTALFDALNSSDPNAFVHLYDNHPEWQAELGSVVDHCLEVLKESGVNRRGDLAAFAFVEKFYDPEQLAILPRKDHTWIALLKDSLDLATFAFVSYHCLEYPIAPGQMCRSKHVVRQKSKSVLETSYTTTKRSDMNTLFRNMRINDRLLMPDSSRFRIKRRSSRGVLVGTWSGGPLRHMHIPRPSEERFRERRQDGENAIRVFVMSRRKCGLLRPREPLQRTPIVIEHNPDPIHTHSINEKTREELYQSDSSTGSPFHSDPLSATGASHTKRTKSQTPTMDDNSTLRDDDTEDNDAGSQRSPLSTLYKAPITEPPSPLHENTKSPVDKATQTDPSPAQQEYVTTPSPTKSSEFLLPVPETAKRLSRSSHHHRGSESDVASDSTRRSHRSHSESHSESNGSSSRHRHRHRRSHGNSSVHESSPRGENLARKWGFK